jgi:hypothetical protein
VFGIGIIALQEQRAQMRLDHAAGLGKGVPRASTPRNPSLGPCELQTRIDEIARF